MRGLASRPNLFRSTFAVLKTAVVTPAQYIRPPRKNVVVTRNAAPAIISASCVLPFSDT